jgi:diguanylate cyclase (GGDEF)-like protein/PAS domain S-box-containing protein
LNHPLILQRVWLRFTLAFALVALAAALRKWPLQFLDSTLVWLTFYPAILIVAMSGGVFAGLLATFLSCITAVFLWPLLVSQPFINQSADWFGMAIFVFTGFLSSGFGELLRRTLARMMVYRSLFDSMDEGFCVVEMIYDPSGKPVDYRFIECNPAFEKQTGFHEVLGKTIRELVPDHESHWFDIYGKVARTGEPLRFENPATGMNRYYDVYAYRMGGSESEKVGVIFKDITEHKELQEKLREQANIDSLTGCHNRRCFLDDFGQEFMRTRRYGGDLSVLMLDLDHFKAINDRHGHQAGDKVLKSFVQVCRRHMREVDVMGRLGGEEFAILLPETEIEQAFEIAERLYKAVAEQEITLENSGAVHVTTSLGIASLAESDANIEAIINRADVALYKAKEAGRNRVLS